MRHHHALPAIAAILFLSGSALAQRDGDLSVYRINSTPVTHPGPFISCAASAEAAVAVRGDGAFASFGEPLLVTPTGSFTTVTGSCATAVGWGLALRVDGSVAFWGQEDIPSISGSIPKGPFVAIAAGEAHALALRADGTIAQWGDPAGGQAPPGVFTAISAGRAHNVAIQPDRTLFAWGSDNTWGQLDPPPGEFTFVTCGQDHSVAIRRSDETLTAWGYPGIFNLAVPDNVGFRQVCAYADGGIGCVANGWTRGWGLAGNPFPLSQRKKFIAMSPTYRMGIAMCYPNCNGSSTTPILNVDDFICFQQRFAAGDLYANCDGSTMPPILNVEDFVCFHSIWATGCPQ